MRMPISIGCLLLLTVVANINAEAVEPPKNLRAGTSNPYRDTSGDVLSPASRDEIRLLGIARRALQQRDYTEAAMVLQALLEPQVVDGFTAAPENTATCRTLKFDALRVLDTMPREAHECYELQFGEVAQKLLDEAVESGDHEHLARLATSYFHTDAGCHARMLLARHRLFYGRHREALWWLWQLDDSPVMARRCEPELSLLMSVCWSLLGERDKALDILRRLRTDSPRAMVRIGDEQLNVDRDAQRIVRLLDETCGAGLPSEVVGNDWPTFRGDAARNAEASWQGLLGERSWALGPEGAELSGDADDVDPDPALMKGVPMPLIFHPLAVSGQILVRTTANRVLGIEVESGECQWQFCGEEHPAVPKSGRAGDVLPRIVQYATYGHLVSDGRRVFLVDGRLNSYTAGISAALARNNMASVSNRLICLSLRREGAVTWAVGGVDGGDEPELAGAFFLGAPVCQDDRLYVIAEIGGGIVLAALRADSGRLRWSQPIAYPALSIGADLRRQQLSATPLLSDGVVVCPTSAGSVVVVDALTGHLHWGCRYVRSYDSARDRRVMQVVRVKATNDAMRGKLGWHDCSTTVSDGRLLLAPADCNELVCFDLMTGKLKWARDREAMVYVACVHDGKVALVGDEAMTALQLADGSPVWPGEFAELPSNAKPSGRGFRTGRFYYLPTRGSGILKVDLTDGQIVDRIETSSVPGNLLGLGDRLVWQSLDGVFQFAPPDVNLDESDSL